MPRVSIVRRAHRLHDVIASLHQALLPVAEFVSVAILEEARMSKNICRVCERGYLEVATRELRIAFALHPAAERICTWCCATTHGTTLRDIKEPGVLLRTSERGPL